MIKHDDIKPETPAPAAPKSTRELASELLRKGIEDGSLSAAVSWLQLLGSRQAAAIEAPQAPDPLIVVSDAQRLKLIKKREALMKDERADINKLAKRRDTLNAEVAALEQRKDALQGDCDRLQAERAAMGSVSPVQAEVIESSVIEPQPFVAPNSKPAPEPPLPQRRTLPEGWSRTGQA